MNLNFTFNNIYKSLRLNDNIQCIQYVHQKSLYIYTSVILHYKINLTSRLLQTLSSSSYSGNYETLTSQPRSTKNCSATGGMDLSYVTERIIALWFPASCNQQSYRQGQQQAAHMLTNKHGDNYMVRSQSFIIL